MTDAGLRNQARSGWTKYAREWHLNEHAGLNFSEMIPPQPSQPISPTVGSSDWTLADLIDLEILIQEDAEVERDKIEGLRQRDRGIYKQFPRSADAGVLKNRRGLFHFWLDVRLRERFRSKLSLGAEILSLINWSRVVLLLAGLLVARGAVWSMLRENEVSGEPSNVLGFGLACIALPFVLTLYGFWVLLGQKAIPKLPAAPAFIRGTLFELIQPMLRKFALRVSAHLGPERRLNAQTLVGALKQRVESRKSAIGAMLFHLVQAFGIAFTGGVLVFSWINCLPNSRAFGWQTTDQRITAAFVHSGVKRLASPWSWLRPEGIGFPTLRQVEQTQFVRFGDRAPFRDSKAASAWAAFLIWSALIYGFIPRLILNRLSARQVATALRAETFEELRFDALWERMTLERGGFKHPETGTTKEEIILGDGFPADTSKTQTVAYSVLLPAEIHTPERALAIEEWLQNRKGWNRPTVLMMRAEASEKAHLIAELRVAAEGASRMRILLVQESFMPPVQQSLDFLRHIRSEVGAKGAILVGLLGKPDGTPFARPPKKIEADVWRKKVTGLGDPNLEVFSFVEPE